MNDSMTNTFLTHLSPLGGITM